MFDSRILNSAFFKKEFAQDLISYIINSNKKFSKEDKILVLREQGIGEEILFSSIYKDLISYSKNIIIETDSRLIKIFERSFNKKIFVVSGTFSKNLESLKKFDSVIFAGSLCKKFRKNINNFKKEKFLITDEIKNNKISQKKFLNNTKLKVDNQGLLSLNTFDTFPTVVEGGLLFIDSDFYIGI